MALRPCSDRDFNDADYEALCALDERVERRGADPEAIAALPTFVTPPAGCGAEGSVGSDLGDCCVCMEKCAPGQRLLKLPCLHHFHVACCHAWLKQKPVCPICQRHI